jgi:hypothetical protein
MEKINVVFLKCKSNYLNSKIINHLTALGQRMQIELQEYEYHEAKKVKNISCLPWICIGQEIACGTDDILNLIEKIKTGK